MTINFECGNCGKQYSVAESFAGKTATCKGCGAKLEIPQRPSDQYLGKKASAIQPFKEYKVVTVKEGGCGTLLVGSSMIPEKKLEAVLNEHAREGWQVVFQILEKRRLLLFWTREAVLITFGR